MYSNNNTNNFTVTVLSSYADIYMIEIAKFK